MSTKLPERILEDLRPLEQELQGAVQAGEVERAAEIAGRIQTLLGPERRRHHRLLRAKLWAFEAALDANRLSYAESGFRGIRQLAHGSTRLYLEATSLLAVVLLRRKQLSDAKPLISEVFMNLGNIESDQRRRQFQKRLINRLEEESILTSLSGAGTEELDPAEIHEKAVQLLQRNSREDLLRLLGNTLPSSGLLLLHEVREYSLGQLPATDRKLLPPTETAEKPMHVGRRVFSVFGRILWKSFCHESSSIYRLWSKRAPKVFNEGYFASAVAASLTEWSVGLPLLGSGLVALIMMYSAEELCKATKPRGLMISRREESA